MTLDDFLDGGNDSSTDSSSTSKDMSAETDTEDDGEPGLGALGQPGLRRLEDGNIVPNGPAGFKTSDEQLERMRGEIELEREYFKLSLPTFPHITSKMELSHGARYSLELTDRASEVIDSPGPWWKNNVACVCMRNTKLFKIPRECIMLDTGEVEKESALDVLADRFGHTAEGETEVWLNILVNTRHATKLGLADANTFEYGNDSKEKAMKAVFSEDWASSFYEGAKYTEIPEW